MELQFGLILQTIVRYQEIVTLAAQFLVEQTIEMEELSAAPLWVVAVKLVQMIVGLVTMILHLILNT